MFTMHVVDAHKEYSPSENATMLVVSAEIYQGKTYIETKKYGYALGTDEETVQEDLKKCLDTYCKDYDLALLAQEELKTDKAIETIVGSKIGVQ